MNDEVVMSVKAYLHDAIPEFDDAMLTIREKSDSCQVDVRSCKVSGGLDLCGGINRKIERFGYSASCNHGSQIIVVTKRKDVESIFPNRHNERRR